MLQVLRQIITLFVLYITLKQTFAFYPAFYIGVYKHMEKKRGQSQYPLDYLPGSILRLCSFSFTVSSA